jgi:hypothetical protein
MAEITKLINFFWIQVEGILPQRMISPFELSL